MADEQKSDKNGLDRSVLSYIDVSLQPKTRFYLIVDEGMGQKALFAIDQLEVLEHVVTGYRDGPPIQLVVKFSPHLPWRMINASEIYVQDSRTVYEREAVESRELHDMTKRLRKELAPADEKEPEEEVVGHGRGQYL
jgi:hypothetical protein